MNVIHVSDSFVLNADHIVSVSFFEQEQVEQDGRKTYDTESIDESVPYTVCGRRLIAEVGFDFVIEQENFSGNSTTNDQASRRFYGLNAEAIRKFYFPEAA